jgi:hypothetical protein
MPRYFFNFTNETTSIPDLVGQELPDDQIAKQEAGKLAGEISMNAAIRGKCPTFDWVEIVDECERPIARLPVATCLREPNRRS